MKLRALFNVGGHIIGKPDEEVHTDQIVDVPDSLAEKLLKRPTPLFTKDLEPVATAPPTAADAKVKTTRSPIMVDSNKNKGAAHFGLRGSVSKEDEANLPSAKDAERQPVVKTEQPASTKKP